MIGIRQKAHKYWHVSKAQHDFNILVINRIILQQSIWYHLQNIIARVQTDLNYEAIKS